MDVVPPVASDATSGFENTQSSDSKTPAVAVGQPPQAAQPQVETNLASGLTQLSNATEEDARLIAGPVPAEDEDSASTDADPDTSNQTEQAGSTASVKGAGMVSANIPVPMKTTAKPERTADSTEQKLPQRQIVPESTTRRAQTPSEKMTPDTASSRTSKFSEAPETATSAIIVPRTPIAEVEPTLARLGEVRTQAMDRLTQAIAEQVLSFKRVGTSSLDVSMQPDRNTELSLHLTIQNGQVEVVARLERGSFDVLQAHWGELQQTLAQQGVRVGQLTSSSAMSDQGQPQFLQQGLDGQTQRRFEQSPGNLDELPWGGAPNAPIHQRGHKPTTAMHRGWEMWA